jgi:hypothetical protein
LLDVFAGFQLAAMLRAFEGDHLGDQGSVVVGRCQLEFVQEAIGKHEFTVGAG